jgi:hypothetical protein
MFFNVSVSSRDLRHDLRTSFIDRGTEWDRLTVSTRYSIVSRNRTAMQPAFQPFDKNESQERCLKRLDGKILATW